MAPGPVSAFAGNGIYRCSRVQIDPVTLAVLGDSGIRHRGRGRERAPTAVNHGSGVCDPVEGCGAVADTTKVGVASNIATS